VIKNGHELMGRVVGTGCMAASVIASFAAVSSDITVGAAEALAYYGIAGETAAPNAGGPGTFIDVFIDAIHNNGSAPLQNEMKVELHEG
jgi:hydroxyethylthiazole kinase